MFPPHPGAILRTKLTSQTAIALLVLGTSACEVTEPIDPLFLAVTEIEVTGITDVQPFSDNLDVEVHLYDALSGGFLGCSGEDSGLRDVDESDVTYFVNGFFQAPPLGNDDLRLSELFGRDLFIVVIEDDTDPCPLPTNEGSFDVVADDLIGESPVFRGEDLAGGGLIFGFDNVVTIVLEGLR